MTKTVTAMEVRQKFGEILNRVSLLKEEIIIERAGKKIAKLSPADAPPGRGRREGKLDFRKAAGLGREIWESVDVADYINKEREAWE